MPERAINDHVYRQFLNEEKLMGSKCAACGSVFVPPRPLCSKCRGTELQWVEMQGTGKLAAFTCIAIGPPSMIEQGFNRDNPYCSAVIELQEGPRVVARVEGLDMQHPQNIEIGTPLKSKFLHRRVGDDTATSLLFTPL